MESLYIFIHSPYGWISWGGACITLVADALEDQQGNVHHSGGLIQDMSRLTEWIRVDGWETYITCFMMFHVFLTFRLRCSNTFCGTIRIGSSQHGHGTPDGTWFTYCNLYHGARDFLWFPAAIAMSMWFCLYLCALEVNALQWHSTAHSCCQWLCGSGFSNSCSKVLRRWTPLRKLLPGWSYKLIKHVKTLLPDWLSRYSGYEIRIDISIKINEATCQREPQII